MLRSSSSRPSLLSRTLAAFLAVSLVGPLAAAPLTARAVYIAYPKFDAYTPVSLPSSRVVEGYRRNVGIPREVQSTPYLPGKASWDQGGNPAATLRLDGFSSSLQQATYGFDFAYDTSEVVCDGPLALKLLAGSIDFPSKTSFYFDAENSTAGGTAPSCHPASLPSPSNTSSPSSGPYDIVQSEVVSPFLTAKEAVVQVGVESLPADNYANVRVNITTTAGVESYEARYKRGGKVAYSLPFEYLTESDAVIVKDGRTYLLDWYTDWYGSTPVPDLESASFEDLTYAFTSPVLSQTAEDLQTNGIPTPQLVQTAAAYPVVTDTVVRPRNSDIVFMTKPECHESSSDGFWKSTVRIDCFTNAISADGRKGNAVYHDEKSSSGWGFQFLGLVAAFALIGVGASYGVFGGLDLNILGSLTFENVGILSTLWAETILPGQVAITAGTLAGQTILAPLVTLTAATALAASGPSALGKVENSNSLGVGTWTWTDPWQPPAACPDGQVRNAEGNCVTADSRPPTVTVSVVPSTVVTPNTFRVTMSSTGADSCTWSRSGTYSGNWTGEPVPAPNTSYDSGPLSWPVGNATWTFTCTNAAGSIVGSGSVTVTDGDTPVNGACAATHFNCSAGNLDPGSQSSGSTSWTWTCLGVNGGTNASCTEQKPNAAPAPTATLWADPAEIDQSQVTRLKWTSTSATSCTSAGGFSTGGAANNNDPGVAVIPAETTSYAITCTGAGGSVNANTTVTVNEPEADISAAPARVPKGSPSTITWTASDIQSCQVTGPAGSIGSCSKPGCSGSATPQINAQSVFTITCQTKGNPITDSVIVNINPTFEEF